VKNCIVPFVAIASPYLAVVQYQCNTTHPLLCLFFFFFFFLLLLLCLFFFFFFFLLLLLLLLQVCSQF
jgi:hypothetical protein